MNPAEPKSTHSTPRQSLSFVPGRAAAFAIAVAVALSFASTDARAEFAIRDGDTVAFLGDSITAERTYGKIIENYTLLRFPDRKVRFINAGRGGDTAAGGLKRLKRDVLDQKVTLLTVAYGVNDIGWGTRADEAHRKKYLDGVRGIVDECRKRGVRVYICSAAVTSEDPFKSEDGFLQKMCDEGMKIATDRGEHAVDVQRTMRDIQKRIWKANEGVQDKAKHATLHANDGVHLNDLGQLAMAYAILKGLGAPQQVSSATLDAATGKVFEASNCKASDVKTTADGLQFTRLDAGLPFNYGIFFALNYRFIPVPEELNRYMLGVKNLPAGRYRLTVDGRDVGRFTARQLARGVNVSFATGDPWQPGGPWDVQANLLKSLTEARHQLATAELQSRAWGTSKPLDDAFRRHAAETNDRLVAAQRQVVQPQPYRFALTRIADEKPAK